MPRITTRYCEVCTKLVELSSEYGPSRKVYHDPTPKDLYRERIFHYDGVERHGTAPTAPMRRIYVGDGQNKRPIGHICEKGHVALDEGTYPEPDGETHVFTKRWPTSVICRATGEVAPTQE